MTATFAPDGTQVVQPRLVAAPVPPPLPTWLPPRPTFAPVQLRPVAPPAPAAPVIVERRFVQVEPAFRSAPPAPAAPVTVERRFVQVEPAFRSAPPAPVAVVPAQHANPFTRGDGMLGLVVGIVAVIVIAAGALAMVQSMHGWPPGMH